MTLDGQTRHHCYNSTWYGAQQERLIINGTRQKRADNEDIEVNCFTTRALNCTSAELDLGLYTNACTHIAS